MKIKGTKEGQEHNQEKEKNIKGKKRVGKEAVEMEDKEGIVFINQSSEKRKTK